MSVPSPAASTVCAHVVLDLAAATAGAAIERLATGFSQVAGMPAPRALAALALQREAQAATFLGHATALPHARVAGISRLSVAFGRASRPIPWTRDGDLVEFVFLGAVPAEQPRHYLEFMRLLARALSEPQSAAALRTAPDEAAVRTWLTTHLQLR